MCRDAIRTETQTRPLSAIYGVAILRCGVARLRVLAAFGAENPSLPMPRRRRRREETQRQASKAKARNHSRETTAPHA